MKRAERSLEQCAMLAAMGLFQVLGLVVRWILTPDPDLSRLPRLIAFAVGAVLLPDTRYFVVAFPGLALFMTSGLRSVPGGSERPTFLALCYGAQAFYLYLVLDQAVRIPG
jgi:hypothetical protein